MASTPFSTFGPKLSALNDLTIAAGKGLYATSASAWATYDLTSFGRSVGGIADAASGRTLFGLGTLAVQAASAAAITGGSVLGLSGLQVTGNTSAGGSGQGLELFGGTTPLLQSYDRGAGAYLNLNVDALAINLRPSGTTRLTANANGISVTGSMKPSSYTVGTLPSASTHGAGALIYVSNAAGGAIPAYSNATNWLRVSDLTTIS